MDLSSQIRCPFELIFKHNLVNQNGINSRFGEFDLCTIYLLAYANQQLSGGVQVGEVCRKLGSDPRLADGYHGVGISQGGLLLRGLVAYAVKGTVWRPITFCYLVTTLSLPFFLSVGRLVNPPPPNLTN